MSDNNGNRPIIEAAAAEAAAADTKKLTMKGLKIELDDVVDFIENEILFQLTELAKKADLLESISRTLAENQRTLQQANDLIATAHTEANVLDTLTDLQTDVDALKEAQRILSSNQTLLQEGMFVLSGDVMKANPPTLAPPLITMTAPEPEPEPEPIHIEDPDIAAIENNARIPEPLPEPEPEPENIQFGTHQHVVLETIADSCIVMNDILLLCKAMKKVPELTDQTRIALLGLAGRRAGIEIQPGMQVRAGVKLIVA